MKNKRFIHPATCFFLLTQLIVLLSWVGTIYEWHGVKNALSAEGLRHLLRHSLPDFLAAPLLGELIVLAFGIGLCYHSGWLSSCLSILFRTRELSRKERRACLGSIVVGVCWLIACLFAAFGAWDGVRSITGEIKNSPLADGTALLCSLGIGGMGIYYGYAVDFYRNDCDLVEGMSYCFRRFSQYFVTLFFIVQFFMTLRYTGLDIFLGMSPDVFGKIYTVFSILSLFLV